MLRRNTGLTSLDLRNNRLGKAGLLSIAEGVQVSWYAEPGTATVRKLCWGLVSAW